MIASKNYFFYIYGQNNTIIKSKKWDIQITLLGFFFWKYAYNGNAV